MSSNDFKITLTPSTAREIKLVGSTSRKISIVSSTARKIKLVTTTARKISLTPSTARTIKLTKIGTNDHTQLYNIGEYPHVEIDEHIDDTDNPHNVTAEQIGVETGANVNVNADWNATSGDAKILNKPTITPGVTDHTQLTNIGVKTHPELDAETTANTAKRTYPEADETKLAGVEDNANNYVLPAGVVIDPDYVQTENNYTDADKAIVGNTSGTNTGDQDLSGLVPYAGATGDINIGANKLTIDGNVLNIFSNGTIGGVTSPNWSAAPIYLEDSLGYKMAIDGNQFVSDAAPFYFMNTASTGTFVWYTNGINTVRMTLSSDGLTVNGNITGSNLSGTNTGDQDLTEYDDHIADLDNPHKVTLEQARSLNKVLQGNIDFNNNDIENLKALGFKDGQNVTWNPTDFCLNVPSGLGPVLQVGQEIWTIVYNPTPIPIPNGKVVHPVGAFQDRPVVVLAQADTFENFSGALFVTTMEIPAESFGICTAAGDIRGLDTSHLALGDVYLSADTAGELVSNPPDFPDYLLNVGGVTTVDVVNGNMKVQPQGNKEDTTKNFWNGVFRESFKFTVTSNGTTITGNLEPTNGHPNMTMIFNDGFHTLITTPAATVTLTAGPNDNPQENFVYIPASTQVLTVSTSGWPTEEHIKVSSVVLRDAVNTQDHGALKVRNWNDEICDTNTYQGHLSHITERLRQENAKWDSGTEGTVTVDGSNNVYLSITSGVVYQLHKQTIGAMSMPTDDIHVVNNFATPYVRADNINTQTIDSTGASLANKSFSMVFWGIGNSSGEPNHLMMNLPAGSYLKNAPDTAVEDANNYSVYTIPKIFQGTGYLIGRATFVLQADGTSWSLYDYEDLRGRVPNTTAGGGSSGSGVTSWTALSDTPNSYVGEQGKVAVVNADETALEFVTMASRLVYITATAQAEGNLSLSDATNWNTDNSNINTITSTSASTDYKLELYPDDTFTGTPILLGDHLNGTEVIRVEYIYEDTDATKEVHITYTDNAGTDTVDLDIRGTELK